MLYLNTNDLKKIGMNCSKAVEVIEGALQLHYQKRVEQPLKQYINLSASSDRIIAMPAYIGGHINRGGLKWIASVPKNLSKGYPRAHAISVLNCAETGRPLCIVNSTFISALRTAAVSAVFLREALLSVERGRRLKVGLIGCGMIGRCHLTMLEELFPEFLGDVVIFDNGPTHNDWMLGERCMRMCDSWQEILTSSDIVITATTSSKGYMDIKPKDGAILLNISLRDFAPAFKPFVDFFVVDSWEEVCRRNTDIEMMHRYGGLTAEDTITLMEVVAEGRLRGRDRDSVVMFNPMGMAIFDVALISHYFDLACSLGIGASLD